MTECSDTDIVGQVSKDFILAVEISPKSRTVDVLLTALNGWDSSPMKANLLIDSGVYKTLLTEEQWEKL